MKQHERRKKTAEKRHEQKRNRDSKKPRKIVLPKTRALTRDEIVENLDLFTEYRDKDIQYVNEEVAKQRRMLWEFIITGIILIVTVSAILISGPYYLCYEFLFLVILSQVLLALRYTTSRESKKRWQDSQIMHHNYAEGWRKHLSNFDSGARVMMNVGQQAYVT